MSQDPPENVETQTAGARTDKQETESAKLHARITELEAELTEARTRLSELREKHKLFNTLVENSPNVIFMKDLEGRFILVNPSMEQLLGKPREELLGRRDDDLLPPEIAHAMREADQKALELGKAIRLEESLPSSEGILHYLSAKFPIFDLEGNPMGICGIATDISEQKREQAMRLELQEQVIAAKDKALREQSTPLLPIAEGVLAMPLVGAIDSDRAAQIMDTLLDGIGRYRADTAILDITGVRTVDTHVANALVAAARSVRLLGASVVLTGIRPEVAQMLVALEADLAGIVTRGTLQSGVAYALARRAQGSPGGREARA